MSTYLTLFLAEYANADSADSANRGGGSGPNGTIGNVYDGRRVTNRVPFHCLRDALARRGLLTLPEAVGGLNWRERCRERARVLHQVGGFSLPKAKRLAYETTVVEWQIANPPTNIDLEICAGCGDPLKDQGVALASGAWVHPGPCHCTYLVRRDVEARTALQACMPPSEHFQ